MLRFLKNYFSSTKKIHILKIQVQIEDIGAQVKATYLGEHKAILLYMLDLKEK